MAKADNTDLLVFLRPFSPRMQELALWLRDFVWDEYLDCNELIYDNYNALAFGWSLSHKLGDTFCSIGVYSNETTHFGFYWGAHIADPQKILLGDGNQYRYVRIKEKADLPQQYIKELMANAYQFCVDKAKDVHKAPKGTTVTKSVSPKKKRP
ncbi:hypothetical protein FO440_04315 [Mucilaginibacter corticis]|uniref:DUF1801 domain-containing protein n=1 Tax=Mucilaginibacter corticis TaxID=2597670 RepID=A0A556MU51_9SPHI|nr:hypothetical protein [Mucilaginibacter corticis]TSJ43423.1 hypothetical protein FO440_04315 [Mucilaginibacter corticis]